MGQVRAAALAGANWEQLGLTQNELSAHSWEAMVGTAPSSQNGVTVNSVHVFDSGAGSAESESLLVVPLISFSHLVEQYIVHWRRNSRLGCGVCVWAEAERSASGGAERRLTTADSAMER